MSRSFSLYWLAEMPQVHGLGLPCLCIMLALSVLAGRNATGTWIGLVLSVHNAGHGLLRSRRTVKARWDA